MRIAEFKNRLSLKRISNRLIFFVSIGIITSTIALYLFLSSTQQKLIFDSFYTSTKGTLDAAKLGIELSHSEEKYDMMLQVFNWIKARDYFRFICLTEEVDGEEEVLIAFPEKESKPLSLLTKLYTSKSIRDSIYVLKTVWKSKNGNGHLYVGFSTSKIRAYERQIVYDLTLFTFLSVILAVIIVFFITRTVTKPLSDLKKVTDKIRDGKIDERANEVGGGIEVSSVSKAFNKMVDELSRTQKELSNEIYEAAIFVQSILPDQIYSDLRVEWRFLPSRDLGGDAFGYHYLDDKHLAVYLIDVSGHGVGPALLSVSVINILRNQSLIDTDFYNPSSVLSSLNNIFQMDKNGDKFFTAWYGVLNTNSLELNYSAAGHPPAILLSQSDEKIITEELLLKNNFIGFLPNIYFDSAKKILHKNDKLLIYSDGLYEIQHEDGTVLSKENFFSVLSHHHDSLDLLLVELRNLEKNKQFTDDCSVISIKV